MIDPSNSHNDLLRARINFAAVRSGRAGAISSNLARNGIGFGKGHHDIWHAESLAWFVRGLGLVTRIPEPERPAAMEGFFRAEIEARTGGELDVTYSTKWMSE